MSTAQATNFSPLAKKINDQVDSEKATRLRVAELMHLIDADKVVQEMTKTVVEDLGKVEQAYVEYFEKLLKQANALIGNCLALSDLALDRAAAIGAALEVFDYQAMELSASTLRRFELYVRDPLILGKTQPHVSAPELIHAAVRNVQTRMRSAALWLRDDLQINLRRDWDSRLALALSSKASEATVKMRGISVATGLVALAALGFSAGGYIASRDQARYARDQAWIAKCVDGKIALSQVAPDFTCPEADATKAKTSADVGRRGPSQSDSGVKPSNGLVTRADEGASAGHGANDGLNGNAPANSPVRPSGAISELPHQRSQP